MRSSSGRGREPIRGQIREVVGSGDLTYRAKGQHTLRTECEVSGSSQPILGHQGHQDVRIPPVSQNSLGPCSHHTHPPGLVLS